MQKIKGISTVLVVLIIVTVLVAVAFLVSWKTGGGAVPSSESTSQTVSSGSELSEGNEVGDIESDLDTTSFDDVDRDLDEALKDIEAQ